MSTIPAQLVALGEQVARLEAERDELRRQLDSRPEPQQEESPHHLTVQEAAYLARCSPKTVYRAIRSGRLAAFKPATRVLIAEPELKAWIETKAPGFSEPRRSRWPSRSRRDVPGSVALIREMDPGL